MNWVNWNELRAPFGEAVQRIFKWTNNEVVRKGERQPLQMSSSTTAQTTLSSLSQTHGDRDVGQQLFVSLDKASAFLRVSDFGTSAFPRSRSVPSEGSGEINDGCAKRGNERRSFKQLSLKIMDANIILSRRVWGEHKWCYFHSKTWSGCWKRIKISSKGQFYIPAFKRLFNQNKTTWKRV